jgi:hypothetical protein
MAGLGPAIHDFADRAKDVDGHHTGGHDATGQLWVEPGDDEVAVSGDDER